MLFSKGRLVLSPTSVLEVIRKESLLEFGKIDEREIKIDWAGMPGYMEMCEENVCNRKLSNIIDCTWQPSRQTDRRHYADKSLQETVLDDYYQPSGEQSYAPQH